MKKIIEPFNKQKKLLIPLITAACMMMYGCSSQTSAPAPTESAAEAGAESAQDAAPGAGQENENNSAENTSSKESSAAENTQMNESKDGAEDEKTEDDKEKEESKDESEEGGESEESSEENAENDKHIQTVKQAQPEDFPGCSYGDAFEEFFSSPAWKYFESTDGRDVVEFTGECMYAGARTKARMQFIVNRTNSAVTTGALYYDNTPQNTKIITESLNKIFEQYAKAHGIAYTLPAPAASEGAQTNALPPDTQTTAPSADTQANTPSASVPNGQTADTSGTATTTTTVTSGSTQDALDFAAWTNPNIGSWYSPSTGYYVIPFVDNAGHASISFATDNTRASHAAVYYTDAVSAVKNEAGGLTYQGYIYTASGQQPTLIGMVEVSWNSIAELNTLSVKMINGSQTMDTSMAGNDYAYYGTVN